MNRFIRIGCLVLLGGLVLVGCGGDPIQEVPEEDPPAVDVPEENFDPDEPVDDPLDGEVEEPPEDDLEEFEAWDEDQEPTTGTDS